MLRAYEAEVQAAREVMQERDTSAMKQAQSFRAADIRGAMRMGWTIGLEDTNWIRLHESGVDPSSRKGEECAVCTDELSGDMAAMFVFNECAHTICKQCARELVTAAVTTASMDELACPECSGDMLDSDVRLLLDTDEDAAMLEKYERFSVQAFLSQSGCSEVCPKCNVSFLLEHNGARVVCPSCEKVWCGHCPGKPDWHEGVTCDKYQEWRRENGKADEAFEAMIKDRKARIKPCPRCKAAIFKPPKGSGGKCNWMRCRCGHAFCFLCMETLGSSHTEHFKKPGPCHNKLFYDEPDTT